MNNCFKYVTNIYDTPLSFIFYDDYDYYILQICNPVQCFNYQDCLFKKAQTTEQQQQSDG